MAEEEDELYQNATSRDLQHILVSDVLFVVRLRGADLYIRCQAGGVGEGGGERCCTHSVTFWEDMFQLRAHSTKQSTISVLRWCRALLLHACCVHCITGLPPC